MNDSGLDDTVGTLLADRYLVERVVGRGGMSTVYRAVDQSLGRTVAIKLFRTDLADSGDSRRQQAEIRLLASLSHPALVTLFDAVSDYRDHHGAFLVMEYVEGTDLHGMLAAGPIATAVVADLLADVADALSHVHDSDVIHRDIKPSNILVPTATTTGPKARLADFGIARLIDAGTLTTVGSVLGTANYLSPEQALGRTLSPASDVYSLGLVIVEALTGKKSFPGPGIESVSARLNRDPEIPSGFGPGWHDLLVRMTQREPAERPSAHEVAVALRELAIAPAPDRPETVAFTLDLATEPVDVSAEQPTQLIDVETTSHPGVALDHTLVLPQAEPTRIEPVATAAATELLAPHEPAATAAPTELLSAHEPAASSARPPSARPTSARPPSTGRRRRVLVTGAAILVIVGVTLAVVVPRITETAAAPEETSIEYPAVEGDLGTHLGQLQDSVTP